MPFVLDDRIRETSSTSGTTSFTLAGAVAGGFMTFAQRLANGDTTYYCAQNTSAGQFEVGLGTFNAGVLARTTVLANSLNTTATINFTNNPVVFCTIPGASALEKVMNPTGTVFTRAVEFVIDGGGGVITTGIKGDLEMPFSGTITAVRMFADQTGSAVVDIWKDTYANYPPTVADTITAAAKPTITAANRSENTTLTGWNTAIAVGNILRFNVDSAATITRLTIVLTIVGS